MSSKACCLQFAGVFLPSMLNDGGFMQHWCEQRLSSDVHHDAVSMLLAVRWFLTALDV